MPLARQVLHDGGEEIHLALWPSVKPIHLTASVHHAFEGRCFVLAAGSTLNRSDVPKDFPLRDELGHEETLIAGGSAIIAPNGEVMAGPASEQETILTAVLDPALIAQESFALDTAGHCARADLFRFTVDTRRIPETPSGG